MRDKKMDVTVICSQPFYPTWKSKKTNRELEGIKIIRGGANINYPQNLFLKRALLELGYAVFVLKKFFSFRDETDIILPVFPPSLAFFAILPFIKKKTLKVALIHDLQEVYSSNKKGSIKKLIQSFIHKIEKRNFQNCDTLIFLSREMKETAKSFYPLKEEKLFVHYPFVTIDFSSESNDLDTFFSNDKKHVVYSGALGEKQNPLKLYGLFNYASEKIPNSEFHFFSDGVYFNNLKQTNKNPRIQFHHIVEEKNLLELYKKSTVQIIPQKEGTSKASLPSKLPNLLASGCNLLVITDKGSELEVLFQKYKLNTVATLWDNEELCKKLKEITDLGTAENLNHIKVAKELFQLDCMVERIMNSGS